MKVLHYKSNFLNPTETFIWRVITNHKTFEPIGMCIQPRSFTEGLKVYAKPQDGIANLLNTFCFHLNLSLPFYSKTVRKVKPVIIHAHFGFDGYRMINVAKKTNTPLVVSFYGSDVSRLPDEFDWKRRYSKLAKAGSAFIAATQHMKQRLIGLGFPSKKMHVIPFGLDLEKFNFKFNQLNSPKLMMVGRMVEKKGFKFAIEAVKKLNENGYSFTLNLYGDGDLRKYLERKAKDLGIKGLVHFHGSVSNEKVLKEHLNHNILLAPSHTADDGDEEGLPNTILEAMASGTLVITTDHAAISEVIKDKVNGLIVEQENANALANAIAYAQSKDCDTKKMRIEARQVIESRFKIQDVVAQIESLYKNVITNYA